MSKKNGYVEFSCVSDECDNVLSFRLFELDERKDLVCSHCEKGYSFSEELINKLHKLNNLILAVKDAKDILSDTNVAINIKKEEIKIPYRLLLTRMNTTLTLHVGKEYLNFIFRVEPLNENEFSSNGGVS